MNDGGEGSKNSRNSRKKVAYERKKSTHACRIIEARREGLSMINISKSLGVSLKMVVDVLVEAGEHSVKERGW